MIYQRAKDLEYAQVKMQEFSKQIEEERKNEPVAQNPEGTEEEKAEQ